jgi:hypothetical protein
MKPKAAYDNIVLRARNLLRLHDGLLNTRKRRIRKDWKGIFCRVMHWPSSAKIERVDSTDAIIVLRVGSKLTSIDFASETLDDLLRASLTYGVGALDRYVHERVIKGIVASLKKPNLNQKQEQFSIPATLAIRMSDEASRAKRKGKQFRPANNVRKKVQELLHARPLQNWSEIEYAFDLLGENNLAGKLQTAFKVGDIKQISSELNEIVRTRHLIVHEGHLVRHQRAGDVRALQISRKYVQESLDFLDKFVGHLDTAK